MSRHLLRTTQGGEKQVNVLILSRLTNGKKQSKNMCPCADKANSTRNMDRCAWWSGKKDCGREPVEGRLMVHILYLKGISDCTAQRECK